MANWQDIKDMKKQLYIFAFIVGLLSLCFVACEQNSGDILKGTWKSEPLNTTSGSMELGAMTYVFDGKGNYTFTSNIDDDIRTTKGTYTIENETTVRTFYTKYTIEGEAYGEGSDVLTLDAKSKPMTLTAVYRTSGGIELGTFIFIKQ